MTNIKMLFLFSGKRKSGKDYITEELKKRSVNLIYLLH